MEDNRPAKMHVSLSQNSQSCAKGNASFYRLYIFFIDVNLKVAEETEGKYGGE